MGEPFLLVIGMADGFMGTADGVGIIIFMDTITVGDMMTGGVAGRMWTAATGPIAMKCESMRSPLRGKREGCSCPERRACKNARSRCEGARQHLCAGWCETWGEIWGKARSEACCCEKETRGEMSS